MNVQDRLRGRNPGARTVAAFVAAATILVACRSASPLPPKPGAATCSAAPAQAKSGAHTADTDVARLIDDWHDAAAKADETRYFDHFAKGGVFLGTDGKERWTVPEFRAYAHPHFAKGKAWSFRSTRREITFLGDTAWFDEDLDTPNLGPARGTGVVVRDEGGTWKIAQYNLSVPIPNERFKDVKTLIEGGR
jgi:hypothetical protein